MKHKGQLNQQGFTLVEIIVAIVVSAIIIGSLTVVTVNHSHVSQRGRDAALANAFVEAKVEGLRSAGYNALTEGTTSLNTELPSELKAPRSGSLTISTPETGVKKAEITVTYNDQGEPRTYSYSTLIGELGVGQN